MFVVWLIFFWYCSVLIQCFSVILCLNAESDVRSTSKRTDHDDLCSKTAGPTPHRLNTSYSIIFSHPHVRVCTHVPWVSPSHGIVPRPESWKGDRFSTVNIRLNVRSLYASPRLWVVCWVTCTKSRTCAGMLTILFPAPKTFRRHEKDSINNVRREIPQICKTCLLSTEYSHGPPNICWMQTRGMSTLVLTLDL